MLSVLAYLVESFWWVVWFGLNYIAGDIFNKIMYNKLKDKVTNGHCFIVIENKSNRIIQCCCVTDYFEEQWGWILHARFCIVFEWMQIEMEFQRLD